MSYQMIHHSLILALSILLSQACGHEHDPFATFSKKDSSQMGPPVSETDDDPYVIDPHLLGAKLNHLPAVIHYDRDLSIQERETIERAIHSWNSMTEMDLLALGDPMDPRHNTLDDGINGIFIAQCWGEDFPRAVLSATHVKSVEGSEFTMHHQILSFDIQLNGESYRLADQSASSTSEQDPRPVVDLESLIVRELGYGLGLSQMPLNCADSVMMGSHSMLSRTPTAADRAALRHLYLGEPPPSFRCDPITDRLDRSHTVPPLPKRKRQCLKGG